MHIITTAIEKGGVGKTVSTITIADYLHRMGHKVLVIDMDPQANATMTLLPEYRSDEMSEAIKTRSALPVYESSWGFDIAPGDRDIGATLAFYSAARTSCIKVGLKKLDKEYDYVFIDTPTTYGDAVITALEHADWVFIPISPHGKYEIRGLEEIINTIGVIQDSNERLEVLGILPTMCNERRTLNQIITEGFGEDFGDLVFDVFIPDAQAMRDATFVDTSIEDYDPKSKVALAYKAAAIEFVERINGK